MTAILDYGVGNLFSLVSAQRYLGIPAEVTGDPQRIRKASRLILPGVGAFPAAAEKLARSGLFDLLLEEAKKKPILGICLGMQLLFDQGNEFQPTKGLSLIPGTIEPMKPDLSARGFSLKVPQIGWNPLIIHQKGCPLLRYTGDGVCVYFVHSFYAKHCAPHTAASAEYGIHVPAVVQNGHVFGVQFHPEKSGEQGLLILKAFEEV